MIKADKGDLTIIGTGFDLTFELNAIITQMAKACPEILCGVLSERTDTISYAMAISKLDGINHFAELTKEYKDIRKEEGNEC